MSNEHTPQTASRRSFIRQAIAGGGLLSSTLVSGPTVASAHELQSTAAQPTTAAGKLRALVNARKLFPTPVIHDALSAKLSEMHGFQCVFAGGLPISYTMFGVGDYGMLTISELIEFASRIAGEIDIPVIADADDGGGNPLNVYRAVQRYEHGGVGGIMIEDMYGAKHIPGVGREGLMASKEAFADKIKAALDARRSQDFVILARSDALSAKESLQVMEDRVMAYAAAGVDMLFVPAMPIKEIPRLTAATKKPFMGITTQVPLADQEAAQIVLGSISVPLVSLAAGAVHKALGELKATGVIQELQQRSLPSEIMQKIVGAPQNAERAKKYSAFRS